MASHHLSVLARYAVFGTLSFATACVTVRDREFGAPSADLDAAFAAPPPLDATEEVVDVAAEEAVDAALPAAVTFDDPGGLEPAQRELWREAVELALEDCQPTVPGLVHLSITSDDGQYAVGVVGPTVLDAVTLDCVLSSLSLLNAEVVEVVPTLIVPSADSTPRATPSDFPPIISSQITVSW